MNRHNIAKIMEFQVETISTKLIKPSTPTPPHLKSFRLSLLDQLVSVYEYRTPLVLFYKSSPSQNSTSTTFTVDQLKLSLSKTLSLFYPLAGRLARDGCSFECNDEGVPFVEARANFTLSSLLNAPNRVNLVPDFLPNDAVDGSWVPLAVQVTTFSCGGIAIGSHLLHKCLDGISRTHFFKTWAAYAACRDNEVYAPDLYTSVSIFPPCHGSNVDLPPERPLILRPVDNGGENQCVVKAFRFSREAIATLQEVSKSANVPHPTRVEAVSAFLWKHLISAAEAVESSNFGNENSRDQCKGSCSSVLIHSVNMRPHLQPPLPPTTYGKFTTHAIARQVADNPNQFASLGLSELVATLRKAFIDAKDVESLSKLQGNKGEEAVRHHKLKLQEIKKDANIKTYSFASWSGLEVDFGLGMPIWIGFTGGFVSSWFRNFVPLIQTPGFGIDAWLILDKREMAHMESNPEFLALATNRMVSTLTSSL